MLAVTSTGRNGKEVSGGPGLSRDTGWSPENGDTVRLPAIRDEMDAMRNAICAHLEAGGFLLLMRERWTGGLSVAAVATKDRR